MLDKNALFSLSQALNHHSFILNSRFLLKLKYKVFLSKSMGGIFHSRFRYNFIKVYHFVPKMHGLFLL